MHMQDTQSCHAQRYNMLRENLSNSVPEHALHDAADLLASLLHVDADMRLSVEEAEAHPFFFRLAQ